MFLWEDVLKRHFRSCRINELINDNIAKKFWKLYSYQQPLFSITCIRMSGIIIYHRMFDISFSFKI